jgi:hypothetical protein
MRTAYSRTCLWALALGLAVLPTFGHATTVTYVQSTQGCSTSCTVDPNNTVQVSDTVSPTDLTPLATGVFDVLVKLDTGWTFMHDPAGNGHDAGLGFATSLSGLSFNIITPSAFAANVQNSLLGSFKIAPYTWDQAGKFADGLSVAGPPNGPTTFSVLDFTITTGTSLSLTDFLKTLLASTDGTLAIFAADVSAANGNTGGIGFTQDITPGGHQGGDTPLPAALPLFASGTGLLGFLTWRRQKKSMASA